MSTKLSTGLVEYIAGTGSLRDAFHGACRVSLYSGVEPLGADLAATGLVCTILAGGSPLEFETDVTDGVVSKETTQTWSGVNAATATVTWFRVEITTDDRTEDPTALRLQGAIGSVIGEMLMTNPNLVSGATKTIENFRMAVPAA
jgi:hypothetical protein